MKRGLLDVLTAALGVAATFAACSSRPSIDVPSSCADACGCASCSSHSSCSSCSSCSSSTSCSTSSCSSNGGGPCKSSGSGGSAPECKPGASVTCYDAPQATITQPGCQGGVAECADDQQGYGACDDAVVPHPASCAKNAEWSCEGVAPVCGLARWSRAYSSTATAQAGSIGVDAAGNVLVAGVLRAGSFDLGAGNQSTPRSGAYVAKLDASGGYLWSVVLEGATTIQIAVDGAGVVYAAGGLSGSLEAAGKTLVSASKAARGYLLNLSPAGEVKWVKTGRTGFALPTLIALLPSGDPVVLGTVEGAANFDDTPLASAGATSSFALRVDGRSGNPVWGTVFDKNAPEELTAVVADASSNTWIAISVEGSCDAEKRLDYAKLGPNGVLLTRSEIDEAWVAHALVIDAGGTLIAAGEANSPIRSFVGGPLLESPGFVARLASGKRPVAHPLDFIPRAAALDSEGNLVVGGEAPRGRPPAAVVTKLTVDGERFFEHSFAPVASRGQPRTLGAIYAIASDPPGTVVAGEFQGVMDVGVGFQSQTLVAASAASPFVAALTP